MFCSTVFSIVIVDESADTKVSYSSVKVMLFIEVSFNTESEFTRARNFTLEST